MVVVLTSQKGIDWERPDGRKEEVGVEEMGPTVTERVGWRTRRTSQVSQRRLRSDKGRGTGLLEQICVVSV